MATVTDPNFPDFPQAEVEAALRSVMDMAAAQDPQQRATFRWTTNRTFAHPDRAGKPLSLTATPTNVVSHPDVQVRCIVTFQAGGGNNELFTPVAEFDRPRAVIQLLDAEYQQIKDADEVLLGKNLYEIRYTQPPEGLFETTFWYIHVQAKDET